jgi:hypothetical protein
MILKNFYLIWSRIFSLQSKWRIFWNWWSILQLNLSNLRNIYLEWYKNRLIHWIAILIHLFWRRNKLNQIIAILKYTRNLRKMTVWFVWWEIMKIMETICMKNQLLYKKKFLIKMMLLMITDLKPNHSIIV